MPPTASDPDPPTTAPTGGQPGAAPPRISMLTVFRATLVVIASLQAGLVGADLAGASHSGHEIATWSLAASAGLLTAAARPRTASALLPVLATACVISAAVTVRHVVAGVVDAGDEAPHLLLAGGVLILALISGSTDLRPDGSGGSTNRTGEFDYTPQG